ncbi:MAG TPA: dihydrolipoyl dehydrogenase [Deltaproteobacteria bacterium]|nr:dihydrolipoyl dehydrogenase [Deltaproteobacteria bacterium]
MYDLFVIGAGPGGYTAALLAAKKGLRVGIAEGSNLGGTCTNTGCIPTKTYIESINLFNKIKNASRFGISSDKPILDLASLNKRKTRIVSRLVKGIDHLLGNAGVDVFSCRAEVLDTGKVRLGEVVLPTHNLIIASGSRPKVPALFDVPGVWTSDTLFDITELPVSLTIVGGGVIGMEMAHIFSTLGTKVTVIEAMARILPFEDPDVSEFLKKNSRTVKICTSSRVTDITGEGPYSIAFETPAGKEELVSEKILVCIGRAPVVPPGLEPSVIRMGSSGGIHTDHFMQTSLPGVYAIGDVTGEHMYAYVAGREAEIAIDHITGGSREINYRNIPSIIFTSPEIASVGKSLDELDSLETRHGIFPVSALGRARTMEANDGFAHVVCLADGKMARVTIIGPHATELISIASLAIEHRLTAEDFTALYHPHPTLSELLKEAAEDVLGLSVHKP